MRPRSSEPAEDCHVWGTGAFPASPPTCPVRPSLTPRVALRYLSPVCSVTGCLPHWNVCAQGPVPSCPHRARSPTVRLPFLQAGSKTRASQPATWAFVPPLTGEAGTSLDPKVAHTRQRGQVALLLQWVSSSDVWAGPGSFGSQVDLGGLPARRGFLQARL